jgi:hypothetical protein
MPTRFRNIPSSTLLEQIDPLRRGFAESRRQAHREAMFLSREITHRRQQEFEVRSDAYAAAHAIGNSQAGLVEHAGNPQDPREMYAPMQTMRGTRLVDHAGRIGPFGQIQDVGRREENPEAAPAVQENDGLKGG